MQSLESYRIFYIAASFENFTRAAEELFVTQSSVSQSIKKLEAGLGIELFLRRGKRVQLTEEGRILFSELKQVFSGLEEAEKLMKEYRFAQKGNLTIGASDTLCRHYLIDVLADYKKSFPQIHINIINKPSPQVAELLSQGKIDLGFVNGYDQSFPTFKSLALMNLEEQFFTNQDSPLPDKELSLKELASFPQVSLTQNTSTRALLEELFRKERLRYNPEVQVISIDLMIDLVKIGFGIGFSHSRLIKKEGLRPLKVDIDLPSRSLLMLTNPKISPSKAGGLFDKLCRKHFLASF